MARYKRPEIDKYYAAAQRWVDAALESDVTGDPDSQVRVVAEYLRRL